MNTHTQPAQPVTAEDPDVFIPDDPYPEENPPEENADDDAPPTPVDLPTPEAAENGSAARPLWDGLLGSVIGLLEVPLLGMLMRAVMLRMNHGQPAPLHVWVTALVLLMLLQIVLYRFLQRRISTMCAMSFGVCAFFCLIPAVGIVSDATSLNTP